MADVTGPVSTLPGSVHKAEGSCDDCGQPATRRVQGETDSFGAEYADLCDACFEEERARRRANRAGNCDWCDKHVDLRIWTRDYDEGMHGATYRVCKKCYDRQQAALTKELKEYYGWRY